MSPAALAGSPFEEEYRRTAPNPQDWPTLIDKVKELDSSLPELAPEVVRSIDAPTLIVVGDADAIRPEHAVEMFRLFGGGVAGDLAGLPRARLAVVPGTTHVTLPSRADLLLAVIPEFLDG